MPQNQSNLPSIFFEIINFVPGKQSSGAGKAPEEPLTGRILRQESFFSCSRTYAAWASTEPGAVPPSLTRRVTQLARFTAS